MLDSLNLKQILFLDIETVPQHPEFDNLDAEMKKHWEKKSTFFRDVDNRPEEIYQRAGIYAEFGKVICISIGAITGEKGDLGFKIKSFYGDDEEKVLSDFALMCKQLEKKKRLFFCAHNGKEFDFPYIARRMLIQGIDLPEVLNIAGKKPWEVNHIDTLELWKFGDYKHFTSLDLLTHIFNIPSPKQDIDGSMVAHIYYNENDLTRIKEYCERDVLAVAQLIMRYMNRPLIKDEEVVVQV